MYNFLINVNDLLKMSMLILLYASIHLGVHAMVRGDTHPFGTQCSGGGVRQFAVRKGLVRITHTSCYIIRTHQFLLKTGPIFIKIHSKRDIQSHARAFLASFQHLLT